MKHMARKRGIEFKLTFEEWFKIWTDSDHLHERGTKRGQYVMARNGDQGAYEVGNVRIVTTTENVREWYDSIPAEKHLEKNRYASQRAVALGATPCHKTGTCPHCGIETNLMNLARYHMDKCRHNPAHGPKAWKPKQVTCPHCGTVGVGPMFTDFTLVIVNITPSNSELFLSRREVCHNPLSSHRIGNGVSDLIGI